MSEIALKSRLNDIEGEIIGLWNGCEDVIEEIHSKADYAIRIAWKIGALLLEAKKELGHGNFGLWEAKMGIPVTTGSRYMQLASKYSTLEDLPENKRQAYLSIGLLPDKDQIHHEGDVKLTTSPHYLQFFNRWNNWHNQVVNGKKEFVVNDQVKTELKPMYEWMKGIYGEI